MLIEEFESLLLRYVDADEEASVEFLETECKTYEQNHNIIQRDISSSTFRPKLNSFDQWYHFTDA